MNNVHPIFEQAFKTIQMPIRIELDKEAHAEPTNYYYDRQKNIENKLSILFDHHNNGAYAKCLERIITQIYDGAEKETLDLVERGIDRELEERMR